MPTTTIMLLGRSVWARHPEGWRSESCGAPGGTPLAGTRIGEAVSASPPGRRVLIFEPDGMAHQGVETPKVSRTVFASLAKVRSEFPVVDSEGLGWGLEFPEPAPGGGFSTLLHSEITPELGALLDDSGTGGSRPDAAWPLFTASLACAPTGATAPRTRFVVVLTPDFVAVSTCLPGRRSFKAWSGPMHEREWKDFSSVIGDADGRSSASLADPGHRRGSIAVVAVAEPNSLCPSWDGIRDSGRVVAVMGLDELAVAAARMPRSHPANLTEAFPIPRNLDRALAAGLSVGVAGALLLGALVIGGRRQLRVEDAAMRAKAALTDGRLAALARNQQEIVRLNGEFAADHDLTISLHEALLGLSAAVPDELVLTSLSLREDSAFEIEAAVVGPGVDPGALRQAFVRGGFEPSEREGWVFNAASGKLVVRGKLAGPRT